VPPFVIPRDGSGEVLPHDHPRLTGDNRLIRRISDEYVVTNDAGGQRLSSAVFKHHPRQGHLSFDSERCIVDGGDDPAAYVTSPIWMGALAISVGELRSVDPADKPEQRWKIGMVPIIPENPCHAGLWGKVTQGQSNELQRRSSWLVAIPGVAKLESES
jgi:hypothetical protein